MIVHLDWCKEEKIMPLYMIQASFTSEAWATMLKNPQDRTSAVKDAVERLGGKLHGAWPSFGEYDGVDIIEMPDNVSAASIAMAFAAGGALSSIKTTPLLTFEEGVKAMRKTSKTGYKPPKLK